MYSTRARARSWHIVQGAFITISHRCLTYTIDASLRSRGKSVASSVAQAALCIGYIGATCRFRTSELSETYYRWAALRYRPHQADIRSSKITLDIESFCHTVYIYSMQDNSPPVNSPKTNATAASASLVARVLYCDHCDAIATARTCRAVLAMMDARLRSPTNIACPWHFNGRVHINIYTIIGLYALQE